MSKVNRSARSLWLLPKFILGSRIARLILLSNLAALIVLIIGAGILNEMRAGFVSIRSQELTDQAQIFSSLLDENATVGRPRPALIQDKTESVLRSMNLPRHVHAIVRTTEGNIVADSYYLSLNVDVSALPPIRNPNFFEQAGIAIVGWSSQALSAILPDRAGIELQQEFQEEFSTAAAGNISVNQRISERGSRVISISVPIQHVSAVVGVLTIEAGDINEIIRTERAALLPFIGVAVTVALFMSLLLTIAIARPMRILEESADRIRSGNAEKIELPSLSKRKDEIGGLAKSLESMTAALFERIVANEQFAADVAHELKNPLHSINSAIQTLELVQEDPKAVEKLHKVIAKDVKRIDRLITDISHASRLEAEITRIQSGTIDLSKFVFDIVQTYSDEEVAKVRYNDHTLGQGVSVVGREGSLGQVIRNLIDNARSFSPPEGEVFVTVEKVTGDSGLIARVTVEDDGPGIPPDKLEKIFERFYTDRPAGAAYGNNSGLGLSIVRQIIASHRGTVTASNRSETGACFTVDLPLHQPTED